MIGDERNLQDNMSQEGKVKSQKKKKKKKKKKETVKRATSIHLEVKFAVRPSVLAAMQDLFASRVTHLVCICRRGFAPKPCLALFRRCYSAQRFLSVRVRRAKMGFEGALERLD